MIFLVIALLMYLVQNIGNKEFNIRGEDFAEKSQKTLLQNGLCVITAAVVLAISGGVELLTSKLFILAAVFGVFYLITIFLLLKAFEQGSLGSSTLLCNIGMFISAMYGILRFGDDFSLTIGLSILCMLFAVILCGVKDKSSKKGGIIWFCLALSSGISNGVVASIKREAVSCANCSTENFLFWGFLFAAILVLLIFAFNVKKSKNIILKVKEKPSLAVCGIFAGIGTAGGNLFQMKAINSGISSAIVYPFTAGFLVVTL